MGTVLLLLLADDDFGSHFLPAMFDELQSKKALTIMVFLVHVFIANVNPSSSIEPAILRREAAVAILTIAVVLFADDDRLTIRTKN